MKKRKKMTFRNKVAVLAWASWQIFAIAFFGTVPLWYGADISGIEVCAYALMLAVDVFGIGFILLLVRIGAKTTVRKLSENAMTEAEFVRGYRYISREEVCEASRRER